jgi:hypothetical protein
MVPRILHAFFKIVCVLLPLPMVVQSVAIAEEQSTKAGSSSDWIDTLTIDGFLDGGLALNPALPQNGINFGHYYTDRANTPQFNQGVITIQRPLSQNPDRIDYGFKFQGLIGSDARYTEFLGQFEYAIHNRIQPTIVEANLQAHLPILTSSGVDVKIGQFVTYSGVEVYPAKDNYFYTHSFSYNFGPFLHTGAMATTAVNDWLTIYAGITTGIDTFIGWPGDNNNSPSFHGGLSASLLNGDLTVMAITHSGPENPDVRDPYGVGWPNGVVGGIPAQCACNPTYTWRYYNNLMATWKVTDRLTLVTDMSYYRDDGWNPVSVTGLPSNALQTLGNMLGFDSTLVPQRAQGVDGYGVAQYIIYKWSELLRFGARIDFWRDNNNFFAAAYPGYFDNVNVIHGFPAPLVISRPAGQGTSYLALTAGVTITPKIEQFPGLSGIMLRPEIRWDSVLSGSPAFFTSNIARNSRSQGLFLMDVIVPFAIR